MLPAHAPFPTACSFPFQPAAGNHTSTLISESLDGVSVAATRQNAGSFANASAPRPLAGGVNAPALTACASVTATCGCVNVDRLSHGAPIAGVATRKNAIASFMSCSATLSGSRPGGPQRTALLQGPPYFNFSSSFWYSGYIVLAPPIAASSGRWNRSRNSLTCGFLPTR